MSELLLECADALHEPFTRTEILDWFHHNYPDIKPNTVQAHIFGLTAGDAPSRDFYQFAGRRPVLERVGRGLYRRSRGGTSVAAVKAAPQPPDATSASRGGLAPTATANAVLVGCVKSKLSRSAAAKDLYTSTLFARRRQYAEQSGAPWFVVSSRWGLVEPDEVVAPYDLYLGDTPADYRRAWAELVTAQLARHLTLRGAVIEVHAGDHYVDALRPALERAGASVVDPVDAHSMGETLAWYGRKGGTSAELPSPAPADVDALVAGLADGGRALAPADLRAIDRRVLAGPGLYSWWVDEQGAAALAHGLGHPIDPGLIYAGQAGAMHHRSGKPSTNTLRGRLLGMHLGGRARMSTFRLTLGSILWPGWGGSADEARLTGWMEEHLRVIAVPVPDAGTLDAVESAVLARLDPPLNLAKMRPTHLRTELTRLRRRYSRDR